MPSLTLPALLFLSGLSPAAAVSIPDRLQRPGNDTALAFNNNNNNNLRRGFKAQGAAIVTRYSTVFLDGDAARTRTASPRSDYRVDLLNDLWGPCPTTVASATDCGLAGSCVDSFACSDGCGFTKSSLTTFTW